MTAIGGRTLDLFPRLDDRCKTVLVGTNAPDSTADDGACTSTERDGQHAASDAAARHISAPFIGTLLQLDISVRLSSALERLRTVDGFSEFTLANYLSDPESVVRVMMRLPNVGRKTMTELRDVMAKLPETMPVGEVESAAPAIPLSNRVAATIPFFETLLQEELSTRLYNILINAKNYCHQPRSFLDFIDDSYGFRKFILNQNSFGRKSANELTTVFDRILSERVEEAASQEQESDNELVVPDRANEPAGKAPPPLPHITVVALIEGLPPREAEVLQRRYGLGGRGAETLEQVATDYSVTRERIRQVEKKGLARLSHGLRGRALQRSLHAHTTLLWDNITRGYGVLLFEDLGDATRRIGGETLLAIEIVYGSVTQWLEASAFNGEHGWFSGPVVASGFASMVSEFEEAVQRRPLPLPFSAIMPEQYEPVLATLVARAAGMKLYQGYVCSGRIGARKRRTVRLHRLLSGAWPSSRPLPALVDRYVALYPDDPCSVRDARIVMEEALHLFLDVMEDQWSTLGRQVEENFPAEETARLDDDVAGDAERTPTDITLASTFEQILGKHGPLRFVDLREKAMEVLPQSSKSSIGPILITSGRFARLGPGLYGLPCHTTKVASGELVPQGMLATDQCRWFAQAMRAGCAHGDFPAWNQRLELELCRWAEKGQLDPLLFGSLLTVIEPEKWNLPVGDKEYWSRIKARNAEYGLDEPAPSLTDYIPTLDRLLSAAIRTSMDGGINWITVNRVLGKRIDHSGAASLLALLVASGAVSPAEYWQDYHKIAAGSEEVISTLVSKRSWDGQLDWNDEIGFETINRCRLRMMTEDMGWIDTSDLDRLLGQISEHSKPVLTEDENDEIEANPLDSLLSAMRGRRRDEALGKLIGKIADDGEGV